MTCLPLDTRIVNLVAASGTCGVHLGPLRERPHRATQWKPLAQAGLTVTAGVEVASRAHMTEPGALFLSEAKEHLVRHG